MELGYLEAVSSRQTPYVCVYLCFSLLWRYIIWDSFDRVSLMLGSGSVLMGLFYGRRGTVKQADPPRWRIQRTVAVVQRREDVVEVVPDCMCQYEPGFKVIWQGNVLCPTTMPHISSLGTVPCITTLKPSSTHGRYGALNTSSPKKLSMVSGFLRLQI